MGSISSHAVGMKALVFGLAKLFEDIGGTIRYAADVEQIISEGSVVRGVKFSNGDQLHADIVVSNADVTHTYRDL